MAIHKFRSKGERMTNQGWTHFIPDLRGDEKFALKYATLILQIVIDRDKKRYPNGPRYMDEFDVSRNTLNKVLKLLGLKIVKHGSSKSLWVDTGDFYPEHTRSFPTFLPGESRKRCEKGAKKVRKIEAQQGLPGQEVTEKGAKKVRKRCEDGFIHTVSLKDIKKESTPIVPNDAIKKRALEFSQAYPQGGWHGTPQKWTEGLLEQVANRMMDDRFDGLMCWGEFMAATRTYADYCQNKADEWKREGKKGLVLKPVNFIGKDWGRDNHRPQPDRAWQTWREHVPMESGQPDPQAAFDAYCNALLAEGAKPGGVDKIRDSKAAWTKPGMLQVVPLWESLGTCQAALDRYPEALATAAVTLGLETLAINLTMDGDA